MKFIPERGRKPGVALSALVVVKLKFIPERGRKRVDWLDLASQIVSLKFNPVRGRKPVVACIPRLADGLKFIPVRGRKLDENVGYGAGDAS